LQQTYLTLLTLTLPSAIHLQFKLDLAALRTKSFDPVVKAYGKILTMQRVKRHNTYIAPQAATAATVSL